MKYFEFGDIHKTRISSYCKDIYLEKSLKPTIFASRLAKNVRICSFVDNNLFGLKMNRFQTCLILIALFFATSCSDRSTGDFPELGRAELVVISHTTTGDLIDFAVLENLRDVVGIQVTPEKPNTEIQVTLFGEMRAPDLQKNISVSTQIAEGYRGVIDVYIENGFAVGLFGNSVQTPSPVSGKTLRSVSQQIVKGAHNSRQGGTIQITLLTEQSDADQPATSVDSKAEGSGKRKPESDGRAQ
ncbi:hypothetical protein QQ054_32595 [Oscillatoria amoena NRMC-F 0135]|nr:hypothetical protein [Oscillatoria amoena NRMC-F 0135]